MTWAKKPGARDQEGDYYEESLDEEMEDAITETEDEEEEDDGDYSDSVTSVGDDEEEGEGGERDISDISEEDEEDWEVGASICRVPFCPFFGGCYGGVVRFCCQALGAAIFFLFRRCKKMLTVELQVYSHFPTFRRPYVSFYRPMQTDFFPPINSRGTVVVDVPTLPHRPGLQYPVRFPLSFDIDVLVSFGVPMQLWRRFCWPACWPVSLVWGIWFVVVFAVDPLWPEEHPVVYNVYNILGRVPRCFSGQ